MTIADISEDAIDKALKDLNSKWLNHVKKLVFNKLQNF